MLEREAMRWLQLTYKVPSEPSQKRVWVWRRLQNLGAFALQNSVYLLPYSEEVEKQFRQLAHEIHEMGGEASIFSVVALDAAVPVGGGERRDGAARASVRIFPRPAVAVIEQRRCGRARDREIGACERSGAQR